MEQAAGMQSRMNIQIALIRKVDQSFLIDMVEKPRTKDLDVSLFPFTWLLCFSYAHLFI